MPMQPPSKPGTHVLAEPVEVSWSNSLGEGHGRLVTWATGSDGKWRAYVQGLAEWPHVLEAHQVHPVVPEQPGTDWWK